ncbi:MAG: RecQ family ATP-dependent DNA helicase [Acidimicrobiaceae bacterium]|nr:RecQ family ATP-dependent DNA helicase [Acidimicrobiaceae bacterium]
MINSKGDDNSAGETEPVIRHEQAADADALRRCISIDLEITKKTGRIHAFAGVRPDTGESATFPNQGRTFRQALRDLEELTTGAEFVLGHNLIKFDLPRLQETDHALSLLQLPVVDTLWLNPLAFPRHPYHRLVKHYKDGNLQREQRNDPELDARLALKVFAEQQQQLLQTTSSLLTAWHWLSTCSGEPGFELFFSTLRGSPRPSIAEAREAIRSSLTGRSCDQQLRATTADAAEHGWALAYALAWLSASGGNSVMPPWVRHQFPAAARLLRRLRDEACGHGTCNWCREHHNATQQLKRWFGFEKFRDEPTDPATGKPMQQVIVEAAMQNSDVMAILPTGTGKSLCYQIPALSRYDKTGALTVVISPLVALMADQVAGLEQHGISCCATVNGTLSMPERTEALAKVRLGDAAILLISPEQLRSVGVRNAIAQREIGLWVLDEAHCLSKWGHDFRPDYRYVGRFIREKAEHSRIPPVLCLTATAKPEVKEDLCEYFQQHLDADLVVFDGGSRRTNLDFTVLQTTEVGKFHDILAQFNQHLPQDTPGGAIVYCATQRRTEEVAAFLRDQRIDAGHFHAGLQPEEKRNVQQGFIRGDLQAIAATNAFGMGIDKPDVRLVVHADVPSSLENYLQEAGRAGRDQQQAHCILLYTDEDVDRQFGMSARSRLSRREIHGVLRALRSLDRRNRRHGHRQSEAVIATSGEILEEPEADDFTRDTTTDDTRVRTAVAWLEEADLLTREENHVRVFPSSLQVGSVAEMQAKLQAQPISDSYRDALTAMARTLLHADPDDGITTDTMMEVSGLSPEQVRTALHDFERFGIARNETALTAFVHAGVRRTSKQRFEEAANIETSLIELMQELAPNMGVGDKAPLDLRIASQRLKDAGIKNVRPEHVTRTLQGIAQDGRGDQGAGTHSAPGSLSMRKHSPESVLVGLNRDWGPLTQMAERRRQGALLLLDHLLAKLEPGHRGNDLLVKTTLGELLGVIEADLVLCAQTKDPQKLMERALLWLHEQGVVRLNRGLTVFRPAMTIALRPETRGFRQTDFKDLQDHYERSVRQIHVMAEFAEKGRRAIAEALRLSIDYFNLGEDEFMRRWLPERRFELKRETTPESWHKIVESLDNPTQRTLVADDREAVNVLVLAGPGSGKTRVLVHRIAYLVRARRQNPKTILALAYNRHAAAEIRRRLADLIGDDARGVMVLTCHSLAMRLVGASFSGQTDLYGDELDSLLADVMEQAVNLLQGNELDGSEPEEAETDQADQAAHSDRAEEARARLLAGFRWILVDEYQDIAQQEYKLITALAGQAISDADARPSLFGVGDDDQNIYAFNGSSVEFIRNFERDYKARTTCLTDNYRSSRHIIDAANTIIASARDRMKTHHAIHIDHKREHDPPGGPWEALDPIARGRVQILPSSDDENSQAQTAIAELKRLSDLVPDWDWSRCAVIANQWRHLDPVRSICQHEQIPVQTANERDVNVWRLRETQALVREAQRLGPGLINTRDLKEWISRQRPSPWFELLEEALEEHQIETNAKDVPAASFVEWLAEWRRDARRSQRGLLLLTAHRAKGLEFDHVVLLDGDWDRHSGREDPDAPRRLYYVAMTRARQTLALLCRGGRHPFLKILHDKPSVLQREHVTLARPGPELARRYRQLALNEVFLSFAGRKPPDDRLHRAIAALSPGDTLQARQNAGKWELLDGAGLKVGVLAGRFEPPDKMVCTGATVAAIATWGKDRSDPEYLDLVRCDKWEVVVPELVFEPTPRS